MVRRCCAAKTSVGASSAACPPLSMTVSIARSATIVFPEPTSPCSSRFIGCGCAKSFSISAETARWPAVSSKGSDASNSFRSPSVFTVRATASRPLSSLRRVSSNNCSRNASSKVSRSRALSAISRSAGLCSCTRAWCSVGYPYFSRIDSGRKSGTSSSAPIANSIH